MDGVKEYATVRSIQKFNVVCDALLDVGLPEALVKLLFEFIDWRSLFNTSVSCCRAPPPWDTDAVHDYCERLKNDVNTKWPFAKQHISVTWDGEMVWYKFDWDTPAPKK
jgi:hypothetical protein